MNYTRKYQKTEGYFVYGHITPNGMIYIGMSKRQPCFRWHPLQYKSCSLSPYIEQYGWENIKHFIFRDALTKEQAQTLEDLLILQAMKDNWCINKYRSGNIKKDNPIEYQKYLSKTWYEKHKEEQQIKMKQYNEEHKEGIKTYWKRYNSAPEGKIYYRVSNYNRNHTPIETPAEAKRKYLECGYIPTYIKHDDLI